MSEEPGAPPAWLGGAWVRRGVALVGGEREEPSSVLWVQVGPWFADIRVPGPGAPPPDGRAVELSGCRAFSGRVSWDGRNLRWDHDMDSRPAAVAAGGGSADVARVRRERNLLVEEGDGYVEWWEPAPTAGGGAGTRAHGPVVATVAGIRPGSVVGRLVAAAGHAVMVWSDPAPGGARLEVRAGRWAVIAAVGATSRLFDVLSAHLAPSGGAVGGTCARTPPAG